MEWDEEEDFGDESDPDVDEFSVSSDDDSEETASCPYCRREVYEDADAARIAISTSLEKNSRPHLSRGGS